MCRCANERNPRIVRLVACSCPDFRTPDMSYDSYLLESGQTQPNTARSLIKVDGHKIFWYLALATRLGAAPLCPRGHHFPCLRVCPIARRSHFHSRSEIAF